MSRSSRHFVPVEGAPRRGLSDRARELLALALSGFCLYALLCLYTFRLGAVVGSETVPTGDFANVGGIFGYHLAHGFCFLFGYAAAAPFAVLLGYAAALFLHKSPGRLVLKATSAVAITAMLALLLAGPDGRSGVSALTPWGAGGAFGANLSPRVQATFGGSGRVLLLAFGVLVAFLLITEWLFSHLLERLLRVADAMWRRLRGMPTMAPAGAGELAELLAGSESTPARRRSRRSAGEVAAAALTAAADADDADDDAADGEPVAAKGRNGKGKDSQRNGDKATDEAVRPIAVEPPPVVDDVAAAAAVKLPTVDLPRAVLQPQKPKAPPKPKPKPKKPAQTDLPFDEAYPFPPVELFREPGQTDVGATTDQLEKESRVIQQKLASFGIQAEVVAASVGPAVTQFELRLAEGIRVGKVIGFEADLAAALKAQTVRVVAPIPGKDTIGVEVPNPTRQKVYLRDLLDQFGRAEDFAIPLFLGKDVAGNPIVEDLARMPHLLIAGTTGSGKSVCINAILLSVLMTRTPSQVKLILVDPKMVELQAYREVPHLCCDVVSNMKKAPAVLQWAVDEMENRYALLSAAGVNHIKNYNRLGQQELNKRLRRDVEPERVHLPYIVIVIDEFADLMNVAQNEVEESIQRLAQKSRAVGMHVILATQRPSSEVITGIIKANLPCQIAFKVNRRIDSRVILDSNGAEKLIGYGDMLYVPPGGGAMTRAQGTFVSDDEQQSVVKFLTEHGQRPSYLPELVQTQTGGGHRSMADRDALYREAVEIILGQQRGSATLLQRALSVGYTRATRLLEMMEEDGLVGPFVGSKSREVTMTLDEWKVREAAIAEELANAESGEPMAAESHADDRGDGAPGDSESAAASA